MRFCPLARAFPNESRSCHHPARFFLFFFVFVFFSVFFLYSPFLFYLFELLFILITVFSLIKIDSFNYFVYLPTLIIAKSKNLKILYLLILPFCK